MKKNVEEILRNRITIRLTDEQYGRLLDYSNITGQDINKLVRKLIDRKVPKAMNPYDIQKLIKEVDRIGNNINQITKVANTYHTLSDSLTNQLISDIEDLKHYVRNDLPYEENIEKDWYKK